MVMSRAWVSAICRAAFSLPSCTTSASEVPGGHVRAHRHGNRQRIKLAGKPGPHLQRVRLLLIERQ